MILQFGGGNFLRAFLSPQTTLPITVVKPTQRGDYAALREQDGKYHLCVRGLEDGQSVDGISIQENIEVVINPYREWEAFLATAEHPDYDIIVSNTTESGIRFVAEPYAADECPTEFPAKLCRWLLRRFHHFDGSTERGVIFLPCELIKGNGRRLRETILAYADHWELPQDGFREWVKTTCKFYDTLVDRIVSGYPEDASEFADRLSFPDRLLVVAEPYTSWVIAGPPAMLRDWRRDLAQTLRLTEKANVTFTSDLKKYRTLKVRILNGMHILMVAVGIPAGVNTVREFVEHEEWGPWLNAALHEEIIPSLPYPAADCEAYASEIMDRFRNPFLKHKLSSIALNKEDKFRVRVEPSIRAYEERVKKRPGRLLQAREALNQQK